MTTAGHTVNQPPNRNAMKIYCPSCGVVLETAIVEASAPIQAEPHGGRS